MKTESSLSRGLSNDLLSVTAAALRLPPLLLLLLAILAQAQDFTFTTNDGTITITGYTGPGGELTIPDTINGLPVTRIGDWAFHTTTGLSNIAILGSVASIGEAAFWGCANLTSVTIGKSVTNIADSVFHRCAKLTAVYFQGNAPLVGSHVFDQATNATIYFRPGATGWARTFGGRRTDLDQPDGVKDVVVGYGSADVSPKQEAITEAQQQPAQAGVLPRHGPTNVVATLRDEAVWEAVMRYLIPMYYRISTPQFGHTNVAELSSVTNRVFYISVADGDPSDRLLAKLKAIEPKQRLKKLSEWPIPPSDPRLGKDDLILKAGRIKWINETNGVLSAGDYIGHGVSRRWSFWRASKPTSGRSGQRGTCGCDNAGVPNHLRHRMSGCNTTLNFERPGMLLIGAPGRWALCAPV